MHRLLLSLALTVSVAGCSDRPEKSAQNEAVVTAVAASSNTDLVSRAVKQEEERDAAAVRSAQSRTPPPSNAHGAEEPVVAVNLCWQDYCPCEPPQGGPDQMLCRNLRAGIAVDDDVLAGAAGLRDARQQMEEYEAQYGPVGE